MMVGRRIVRGKVWLVGAGPGDPELLTLRAARVLGVADVVAYDELVAREIVAMAPASAERIAVGRRAGGCKHHDAKIHPLVITRALEGKTIVRLKGGDPLVFGRGGEEAEELAAARIPFEIVPGISAALGAAASTHIPLTHREVARSVTFCTAHASNGVVDVGGSVPANGTIVFYMGLGSLEATCESLVAAGRDRATPAAVVSRATTPDERIVVGTLASIARLVADAALEAPALLIVGDVVARAVASPADARALVKVAIG
jgi:uroporphyrin-III C-methyltransferase